jgi:hypothetical protein
LFDIDQLEKILNGLTYFSQYYDLGDKILIKLQEEIEKIVIEIDVKGLPGLLFSVINSAFIAAAHRNVKLSEAIAKRIVMTSDKVNNDYNAINVIQALLIAGASFKDDNQWTNWLEEKLAEVAYRLPIGEQSKLFFSLLQDLKKIFNQKFQITGRAEAIISAAI